MRSGNVADKETDSMQQSDYHYLGFIMGDRNLQKIIHTAVKRHLRSSVFAGGLFSGYNDQKFSLTGR